MKVRCEDWNIYEVDNSEIKYLHRLLCGDSTNIDDVNKLMDWEKADMVFTDPPYNVDYVGKTKEKLKIQSDKMSPEDFKKFINDVFTLTIFNIKKWRWIYICIPLESWVYDTLSNLMHFQSVIVWVKNSIVMGRKDYQQKTEPILYSVDEKNAEAVIYGWRDWESHEWYGWRRQSNVWEFDKPNRNWEHPTMKPIPMIGKAINNSSKKWEIVLDVFWWSGSTMVACHQLNRKCYMSELDPKYVQTIINRMIKLDSTLEIKRNWQSYKPVNAG